MPRVSNAFSDGYDADYIDDSTREDHTPQQLDNRQMPCTGKHDEKKYYFEYFEAKH